MGRQFIRQTVAAWFQPPSVAALNTVYTAEPRYASGQDFFSAATAGSPSGAIAYPYVESQSERRIALGGWKQIDYEVALVVRFASNQRRAEDAQDDHDAIVDAVIARFRADRMLGTTIAQSPHVFQSSEGDLVDSPDLHVLSDLPKQSGQQIVIWSVVRVHVIEMVQA